MVPDGGADGVSKGSVDSTAVPGLPHATPHDAVQAVAQLARTALDADAHAALVTTVRASVTNQQNSISKFGITRVIQSSLREYDEIKIQNSE